MLLLINIVTNFYSRPKGSFSLSQKMFLFIAFMKSMITSKYKYQTFVLWFPSHLRLSFFIQYMESPKFKTSLHCLCMLLLCAATLNPAFALKNCTFPAIFNFGDSNSDTGGLSASFRSLKPPYGETYFHKPAGRESDGRLIIDFMGMYLVFFSIS